MQRFDNRKCVEELVNYLSRRDLNPHPHIRVIGLKRPPSKSRLFVRSTQIPPNIVGYDVLVESTGRNPTIVTEFGFELRTGVGSDNTSFTSYLSKIDTDLEKKESKLTILDKSSGEKIVDLMMDKEVDGDKIRFKGVGKIEINLEYKPARRQSTNKIKFIVKLEFEKNVEYISSREFKIQTKIRNISDLKEDSIYVDYKTPEGVVEEGSKLSLGYLMNYSLVERVNNARFKKERKLKKFQTAVRRLFNVVAKNETDSTIEFSDYYVGVERIKKLTPGKKIDDFIKEAKEEHDIRITPIIGKVFKTIFGKFVEEPRFYRYQEEGIIDILKEIEKREGRPKVITVRTAGGKTETFLVPLIQYCIDNLDKKGVKGIIFYPTKALGNDQATRIFEDLYYTNKELEGQGKRKITMGIYHGDIPHKMVEWVPFKCPKGCKKLLSSKTKDNVNYYLECPVCNETFDYAFLTRNETHIKTPDILITNPDTLTHMMMKNPERHTIFGRMVKYCPECGKTYDSLRKLKCDNDSQGLKVVEPDCAPDLIIFDEIHLFIGAFGMNVAAFLKRLKKLISVYCKKYFDSNYKPVYIASSATIKDPDDFASSFFNTDKINVDIIPKDLKTMYQDVDEECLSRWHLFVLPQAYKAVDTLSLSAVYLLNYFDDNYPKLDDRMLGFVNSIKDCNDLIAHTRQRATKFSNLIDGHNTQFDRDERAKREKEFNKGNLKILYATKTLEVGVDFDDIHVLFIFGAPYSYNDYLQRVGRAGRKNNAVVFTVLKPLSPVDYYYFENAVELLNQPIENLERVPISNLNPHIIEKHILSGLFDYISSLENSSAIKNLNKLFTTFLNPDGSWKDEAKKEVINYITDVFGENYSDMIEDKLNVFSNIFTQTDASSPIRSFYDLFKAIEEKEFFVNLRFSDPEVQVILGS